MVTASSNYTQGHFVGGGTLVLTTNMLSRERPLMISYKAVMSSTLSTLVSRELNTVPVLKDDTPVEQSNDARDPDSVAALISTTRALHC